MRRALRHLVPILAAIALLPGCIVHQPTGRLEALSPSASSELGCTPLLLAVYGREDGKGQIVGGGSGVAVHDRIILTAGHVVPQEARFLFARAGGTADSSSDSSRAWRGQGARIRSVIRGNGAATTQGDWALIILDRPLTRIGAMPAINFFPIDDRPPASGTPILIAGFPFEGGDDMINREPVIVRTTLARPPGDSTGGPAFLYADYVAGRTDFSGLSGGPVFTVPADGGPPMLLGIHIATGVSKFGQLTISRTSVIRRTPTAEIEKAIAELTPPPPPSPSPGPRHGP
jgi:hypothetical protein